MRSFENLDSESALLLAISGEDDRIMWAESVLARARERGWTLDDRNELRTSRCQR
jgi:hypothetical protein